MSLFALSLADEQCLQTRHISDSIFIKLNNAFGATSKATDRVPEIGFMFSFPVKGV